MRGNHQKAAFVEHHLADVHGQFALGQLVDPMTQPLGVQIAADSGAVIRNPQNYGPSPLGVGQAGHLPRQVGSGLLAGIRSAYNLRAPTSTRFFLNLHLCGLNLGR